MPWLKRTNKICYSIGIIYIIFKDEYGSYFLESVTGPMNPIIAYLTSHVLPIGYPFNVILRDVAKIQPSLWSLPLIDWTRGLMIHDPMLNSLGSDILGPFLQTIFEVCVRNLPCTLESLFVAPSLFKQLEPHNDLVGGWTNPSEKLSSSNSMISPGMKTPKNVWNHLVIHTPRAPHFFLQAPSDPKNLIIPPLLVYPLPSAGRPPHCSCVDRFYRPGLL